MRRGGTRARGATEEQEENSKMNPGEFAGIGAEIPRFIRAAHGHFANFQ
jgi:hypothetical protein